MIILYVIFGGLAIFSLYWAAWILFCHIRRVVANRRQSEPKAKEPEVFFSQVINGKYVRFYTDETHEVVGDWPGPVGPSGVDFPDYSGASGPPEHYEEPGKK
jgi:hypothetical protein